MYEYVDEFEELVSMLMITYRFTRQEARKCVMAVETEIVHCLENDKTLDYIFEELL